MGCAAPHIICMLNFNGGAVGLGTSISPLGTYAGYLLLSSGNFWLAVCFLALTSACFILVVAMMCRYFVNAYRQTRKIRAA